MVKNLRSQLKEQKKVGIAAHMFFSFICKSHVFLLVLHVFIHQMHVFLIIIHV